MGDLTQEQWSRVESDSSALKDEKLSVTSGKTKASVRKEIDAIFVTTPKIVHKKLEHTAATLAEPSFTRGRSVSRKRSIRGKSNHGSVLRCRFFLKGTCSRPLCEHWHPAKCHFFQNETGCEAGHQCPFPHLKVDERTTKDEKERPFTQKERKRRQKGSGCFFKRVPPLGCVSQDSGLMVSQ